MAIQTVGMVMAIVFALTILALLFSWINAQVKAYYSPKPYYPLRPNKQINNGWNLQGSTFEEIGSGFASDDSNPATGLPMVGAYDIGGNDYGSFGD